ncbi:NUDIX domain-containing protein [Aureimonas endophytica]|nr:NUDIX domain-containing protein [Aureimonas endophytica]
MLAARPMTLGIRAAAFDASGAVFLVRHTYMSGWYLPGGGLDPGETAASAVARELGEEGNLRLAAPPRLVSVHFNRSGLGRDHVLFFQCPLVHQTAPKPADREIAESGFFPLDALPEAVTPATLRRLAELRGDQSADPDW